MSETLGQSPTTTVEAGAVQITSVLQEQLSDIQLAIDEDDEELETEPADDLEESSDSETLVTGDEVRNPFDHEWLSSIPLVRQLPHRVSPLVRYFFDDELNVHRLDHKNDSGSNISDVIASAIARHIRQSGVKLVAPGDWRHIPAIKSDRELLALTLPDYPRPQNSEFGPKSSYELFEMRFGKVPAKAFAILLPNADVITPKALIDDAQAGMRASRAGALRQLAQQETSEVLCELAGENWTPLHWGAFRKSEQEARRRYHAKRSRKGKLNQTNKHQEP
jgi:hypothetical protein